MILALDLSLKCTGYSIFSSDKRLLDKGRIKPAKDLPNGIKIHKITKEVKNHFENVEDLIVEDIYFGCNVKTLVWLARLSGAVLTEWVDYKYKTPIFYPANTARKLVGLKGNAHKSEVQCWVLDKYNFEKKETISGYKSKITKICNRKKNKELTKGQAKYRLNKLSKNINEQTGIGEDLADSIVIGLAYFAEVEQQGE